MSAKTEGDGTTAPNFDVCGKVTADQKVDIVEVLSTQQLNVTFPHLPSDVAPPFKVRQSYQLPALRYCNAQVQSGFPRNINQSWYEWDVHPFNTSSFSEADGIQPRRPIGAVGDSFIFSLTQVPPEGSTAEMPYWYSANHTIVDKIGGTGSVDKDDNAGTLEKNDTGTLDKGGGAGTMGRGEITTWQFAPTLLIAVTLLFGTIL